MLVSQHIVPVTWNSSKPRQIVDEHGDTIVLGWGAVRMQIARRGIPLCNPVHDILILEDEIV